MGLIDEVPARWAVALQQARAGGYGGALDGAGEFLSPGAALERPALPPGRYRCRLVRLGKLLTKRPRRGGGYQAFPKHFCYVEVEGALTTLVKETGSERPAGRLWPAEGRRMVFLGALGIGNEPPPAFGTREDRDLVGLLERVGQWRWRLVLPRPPAPGLLDVIELVPFVDPEQP